MTLQSLTAEQRDALALRYAADLTFHDVARALDKSEPAAKMLVQRGLQELRLYIQQHDPHAATILARAARVQSNPTPFTGKATTSFVTRSDLVPSSAGHDLGTTTITSSWAFRDATPFRIGNHLIEQGLDGDHNTVVADGKNEIWYSRRDNRALRMPASVGSFATFLGVSALPPGSSLEQYLATFNTSPTGTHARYVGTASVLGRTADVIDISPAYMVSNAHAKPCGGPKACLKQEHGVGRTRLWIDHQYGVVLRSSQSGIPANAELPEGFTHRVTQISFGKGPRNSQLRYTSPGPIVSSPSSGGPVGATTLPNGRYQVPAPFFSLDPPQMAD